MGGVFLEDGANEEVGAEHELVGDVADLGVGAPVHHERALDGVVVAGDAPGEGVDVGHEAVAELVVLEQDGLDAVVGPELVVVAVAVGAKDGAEGAELKPAGVEILVGGIELGFAGVGLVVAADVGGPVGHAGEGEVEAGGDLVLEAPTRSCRRLRTRWWRRRAAGRGRRSG